MFQLIKQRYNIEKCFKFDAGLLNHAIADKYPTVEGGTDSNQFGHFRIKRRVSIQDEEGKATIKRVDFYFKTEAGNSPGDVPGNQDKEAWHRLYTQGMKSVNASIANDMLRPKQTREWDAVDKTLHDIVMKKPTPSQVAESTKQEARKFAGSFWDDGRVAKIFNPRVDESSDDTLRWRIERLELAINQTNGYKLVLPPYKGKNGCINGDPDNLYRPHEIEIVIRQCTHLRLAYSFALNNMGVAESWTWHKCCEEAAEHIKCFTGMTVGSASRTELANRLFRDNNVFPHANHYAATGVKRKPKLFEVFPESEGRLLQFAATHIKTFRLEQVQKFMAKTLLPQCNEGTGIR